MMSRPTAHTIAMLAVLIIGIATLSVGLAQGLNYRAPAPTYQEPSTTP